MMKLKTVMPISTTLLVLPTEILAHPGHDHSHWSSPLLHSIFAITLLAAAGLGAWTYYRYSQRQQQPQPIKEEK